MSISDLPALNASLNTASALLLLSGYFAIRNQKISLHRFLMSAAFLSSTLFLVSYLFYHAHVGSVRFQKTGWIRPLYFSLLLSHTVLALFIVPLALRTLYLSVIKKDFLKHARLARITLPLWFYVSVTGVIVYWMLYQWS